MQPVVLASSSPYRRKLLEQLGLSFATQSPDIDESPAPDEPPLTLVSRLAQQKAAALQVHYPHHLIIGSDQIGLIDNQLLTKPGNHNNATAQLRLCSANVVTFFTSLCLLNSATGSQQCCVEPFTVQFRPLSDQQIERYLMREKPYDCAGSFKAEGLGISLFHKMSGDDPNSLIGLPLIKLVTMLNNEGYLLP